MRVVAALSNNFEQRGVVNKILKLSVQVFGKNFGRIKDEKTKNTMFKALKLTSEDCFLLDNKRVGKYVKEIVRGYEGNEEEDEE